ncbi:SLC13 family permease [Heliorestis convoluta]|uniref:Putative citrate transporter family protein n=1 Tax=Heliorestis convoluta TaxID=356322 RepID=A0A5Q2MVQ1_9FIRM|nr:SLC13 family permease [Heliorestis convoluta]QGG46297.1 putative citrate transporter family protein [Heliorestis convoluta]
MVVTSDMILVFIILAITTVLFMVDRLRSDLVAMGALLALTLSGILETQEALAGFSNPIVLMIAGLFVVGGGLFRTGVARAIGNRLLRTAGNNENYVLVLLMVVVAVLSAFMSNTGTVAVFLPIVVSLALDARIHPGRLLIPLAFASSLGGVMTLIGTPPNLIVSEILEQYGYQRLGFFDYTPAGAVALLLGILFMLTIGKKLLPGKDLDERMQNRSANLSPQELADFYHLSDNIFRLRVRRSSPMVDKRLYDLTLPSRFNISVLKIMRTSGRTPIRTSTSQEMAGPDSVIKEQDILYVQGVAEQVHKLALQYNLAIQQGEVSEADHPDKEASADGEVTKQSKRKEAVEESTAASADQLVGRELGLAEVLLTPHSSLIDHNIEEWRFREKYKVNVLAINRRGDQLLENIPHQRLRFGDALLVQGPWEEIELLAKDTQDVVVVGQTKEEASKAATSGKAPIAVAIMIAMLALMTFEVVPAVIAVLIAAMLMILTGCLRNVEEAYNSINWESVLLIAAMLPMATALEKTGGVLFVSEGLVTLLGPYGPLALMAGIYLLTTFFSQFISNTATALLFAPIAIATAVQVGVSPYPFLMTVAVAASMAFATPVASPTNAMVMAPANYKFRDFVKVGVPLQFLIGLVMMLVLPLLFPF